MISLPPLIGPPYGTSALTRTRVWSYAKKRADDAVYCCALSVTCTASSKPDSLTSPGKGLDITGLRHSIS